MVTIDEGGARAKTLKIIQPGGATASLVDFVWIDDASPRAAQSAARWRIVADDAPHLIYAVSEVRGQRKSRLNLVGPRTVFTDIDLTRRILTVGVRLRPGTVDSLFGVPASETTNQSLPASDLAPRALRSMIARIEDEGPDAVASHLTTLLQSLTLLAGAPDRRAAMLAGARATMGVDQVAQSFGISHRGVRAWSQRVLGMGLKRFLRIQRLHRAALLGRSNPAASWSTLAAHAGYADQSHCIRDFRELLGETPAAFLARGRAK